MEYLKIDLGCGPNKKNGTVGIDYIAYPGVDYVLNLEKDLLPLPDSSVDYIYSSHFLEHIDDPFQLFTEVSRICVDKAQLEFWTPYTWENSAFIFGHKKFYNEDDYMHLCVWFPHFWEANLKARWLLKEFVYTIEPKVLIDLYKNGIQLDFAIKYYKGVVREFGAIMEVRHNYQGEIVQPQYSFSTNRLAQRYPIQSLSVKIDENEDDLAEAINWFQMKQERLQTNFHPNQIVLARSQSQLDETEVQPDETEVQPEQPQIASGVNLRWQIADRYLSGNGIEVGALHSPLEVPANAQVRYVDRMPVAELRKQYPELAAHELVEVDIVDDGEALSSIADASVDFVISNHMIEHCQNPIGTIEQHLRVVKPGGVMYMAVPDKQYTFDSDRPVTTLEHLIRDYTEGPQWSMKAHFEEWVRLVMKTPEAEVAEQVERLINISYSIHFHVWTKQDFLNLLLYCKEQLLLPFEIEFSQESGIEFIVILRKLEQLLATKLEIQSNYLDNKPQPVNGENQTHNRQEILLPQLEKIQANLNKSQSWLQDIQAGLAQQQLQVQQAQERIQKKSFSLPSLVKFAFISGCPAASYVYRCHHQAEMLRLAGCEVEIYMTCTFPYDELIAKKYPIVVAHRIACTDEFENFVVQAHALGMKIIYELDDLIFDVDRLHQVDLYNNFDIEEKKIFIDQVKRNRQAIELCDGVVVSTNRLEREIKINFPGIPVIISRNRISQKMEEEAIQARLREITKDKFIRIAYFSGTKSHQKDFAECVDGLYNILQEFPDVRLMIVGYLDIPKSLHEFSAQIEMLPFVDPSELPYLYRKVDINLAPLESKNDFTECKSELKYFEAGLLGVPTVASSTSGFQVAIKNGFNGHLCSSTREWTDTLRELVTNPELRHRIGQRALEDVNSRYLTRVAAYETLEAWQNLFNQIGL